MATNEVVELRDPLPPRHRAFVLEYLKDYNASAAYVRAGYQPTTKSSAEVSASMLLSTPKVRAEVDRIDAELRHEAKRRAGLSLEKLYTQVARGAFFDPRKLLDADGNPLPLHELDDDTASAIAGIEVETKQFGEGPVTVIRKYKLVNRDKYVDMGLKALNGYKEDREAAGAGAANALVSLLGSMRRSALPVVEQVDDDNGLS